MNKNQMTPTDNKAPREWALFPTLKGGIICNGPQINEPTMVIEKSAYDKLQQELDAARAQIINAQNEIYRYGLAKQTHFDVEVKLRKQLADAKAQIAELKEKLNGK